MRLLAAAVLMTTVVSASAFPARPTPVDKTEPEPRFDPATVIDIMGAVVSVREVPRGSPLSGIHLLVSTENEEIDAYLGPADFLKEFEITFSRGDSVQIVGSKVTFEGGRTILVREVRKGEVFLYLRDHAGHPNWPQRRTPVT
jgi:hypothetical protein